MGLVGFLLAPVASQTSVDYLSTDDFARRPLSWLQLMARNRATISYAPTFAYDLCARRLAALPAENVQALDLSRWRVAGIGGEMVRAQALERFAEVLRPTGFNPSAFCASYGLAECVLAVSFARGGLRTRGVDRAQGRGYVSCGHVLPGHELQIRAPQTDRPLPFSKIGRIFVRGPSVMRGYFGDAEASHRVLHDGWLDTGDIGFRSEDGLHLVGRAKDMLVINGRNVWPQDVEWALETVAGLRPGDAAVLAPEEADDGQPPTILVQCRLTESAQRLRLAEQVHAIACEATGAARFDVRLIPPHSLPKTSSGKLARQQTRELLVQGSFERETQEIHL